MNAPTKPATQNSAPAKSATPDPTKQPTATALAPAPFKITPIRQRHSWFKALFYGPYGSGKTTLAGTSVDVDGMGDVIMVNAESGTMSIEESDKIANKDYIDQVRVTDFNTVAMVQEFLVKHCQARDANDVRALKLLQSRTFGHPLDCIVDDPNFDELDEYDSNGKIVKARLRRFRTCIVDSLAEIDSFSQYQILGITTDMKLDKEMEIAGWPEFRKNNQKMQLVIRAYRDLNMHVLLVAGNKYSQDELKRFHWGPNLTGQLAAQVQGFVDVVGYLQVGKPDPKKNNEIPRALWIQPVGMFDAKSRLAGYKQPAIQNPTMQKIMNIFEKKPGQKKILQEMENEVLEQNGLEVPENTPTDKDEG